MVRESDVDIGHPLDHVAQTVELLRRIFFLDVWQQSFKGNGHQLTIIQLQFEASASDISEALDVIIDRFLISLSNLHQIGDAHLMQPGKEVLVELFLQIGPLHNGICW